MKVVCSIFFILLFFSGYVKGSDKFEFISFGVGIKNKEHIPLNVGLMFTDKNIGLSFDYIRATYRSYQNAKSLSYDAELSVKINFFQPLGDKAFFSIGSGIGWIHGKYVHPYLILSQSNYSRFGVPVHINLEKSLSDNFGIGVKGFCNINSYNSFIGVLFTVYFGALNFKDCGCHS